MNTYIVLLAFLTVHLVQWLYTVHSCEKRIFLSSANVTKWDELNTCMIIHTSLGLNYLIDKFAIGIIYIFEHLIQTMMIILICLSSYGSFNRNSDVAVTMSSAIDAFRHDLKLASNEIWTSMKNVCTALSRSITIIKIIELLLIGLFLGSLPDVLNFLLKTLAKLGKL
jgi:hypothetical protein